MYGYPLCQHIKSNGLQCGSPALRGISHCYFHHQRNQSLARNRGKAKAAACALPPLEDANAVQVALMEVSRALLEDRIELKRAALLLYSLQIASANLKHVNFEPFDLKARAEAAAEAAARARAETHGQPATPQKPSHEEVVLELRKKIFDAAPSLQEALNTKRPVQSAPVHSYLMHDQLLDQTGLLPTSPKSEPDGAAPPIIETENVS